MSAPNESPGSEPTPGNGSDPEIAQPSEGSPSGSSGLDPANLSEYERRAFEGGEAAVNEVKNWQRKFNEKQKALDDMGPLKAAAETYGTDAVWTALQRADKILGDPKMRAAVERFENGGAAPSSDDDDYSDPEDPMQTELRQLRQANLETQSQLAQQTLQGHFSKVFETWKFTPEEQAKIDTGVKSTISAWGTNDQGVKALKGMNYISARNLVFSQLSDDEIQEVTRRNEAQRTQQRQGLATDAQPTVGNSGQQVRQPPKGADIAQTALNAWRAISKDVGDNPDRA